MDSVTRLSTTLEAFNRIDRTLRPLREIQERFDILQQAIGGPIHRHLRQAEDIRAITMRQGLGLPAIQAGLGYPRFAEMARLSPSYELACAATARWERTGHLANLGTLRLGHEQLAERLTLGGPVLQGLRERWAESQFGMSFSGLSAFSAMLDRQRMVGVDTLGLVRHLSATGLPNLPDMGSVRSFLDAAGLVPPLSRGLVLPNFLRAPRVREVPPHERRARLQSRKRREEAPRHVVKAYRLVHTTERTLRRVLEELMTFAYGEDWAEERLPLCGCKDLLGKWRARGGLVLDHADWTHHARIMGHPDHHADIFAAGFENTEALAELMARARSLRAIIGHVNAFTPQNLLDLRLVFTTLEGGLIDSMPGFEFAPDHDDDGAMTAC